MVRHRERAMHFTLKNLGRLEEATIDLGRDLILLTGPNNTSKTYVAHAIYGFSKEYAYALYANVLPQVIPARGDIDGRIEVDVVRLIKENAALLFDQLGRWYKERLSDVFAADEAFASRAEVVLALDSERVEDACRRFLELSDLMLPEAEAPVTVDKEPGTSVMIFTLRPALPHVGAPPGHADQDPEQRRTVLFDRVRLHVSFVLYILLSSQAPYILTAERSAIQLFSRELSLKRSDLVDSLLTKAKEANGRVLSSMLTRRARRYPLPIRDGLETADDLTPLVKVTSPYAHLADRLEKGVLEGSVRVSDNGDLRFHPDHGDAGLELHLTSSSVKSLSSLSFYLRHLAREGQFLIIDEPELNLHPDNQRRVARLLVRLARSGIKVMISTHSDYVIREINNAIMLSADTTGALREKYGYEELDTISPDRVGAYLFDAKRARPIQVEPTGIEVATIDEEINKLNASSQDIYYSLFYKKQRDA